MLVKYQICCVGLALLLNSAGVLAQGATAQLSAEQIGQNCARCSTLLKDCSAEVQMVGASSVALCERVCSLNSAQIKAMFEYIHPDQFAQANYQNYPLTNFDNFYNYIRGYYTYKYPSCAGINIPG